MRPTKDNLDYDSNENGTNTYFYYHSHKLMVQVSWQTSSPNFHFIHYNLPVDMKFWNYYPLENSYDWYYDYHIRNIRLHECKYYHAPEDVKTAMELEIPFVGYCHLRRTIIGKHNAKIMLALKRICNFIVTFKPNPMIIQHDQNGLNGIIDLIHRKGDEKMLVGNYRHTSPYSLNSYGEDKLMELTGYGFNCLEIMRKILKACRKYERSQAYSR